MLFDAWIDLGNHSHLDVILKAEGRNLSIYPLYDYGCVGKRPNECPDCHLALVLLKDAREKSYRSDYCELYRKEEDGRECFLVDISYWLPFDTDATWAKVSRQELERFLSVLFKGEAHWRGKEEGNRIPIFGGKDPRLSKRG